MVQILQETVYPMLVMGGLAVVFAIGLGIAGKVFYVYVDPKIKEVESALVGANCGGCGFASCSDCAQAIVEGRGPQSQPMWLEEQPSVRRWPRS